MNDESTAWTVVTGAVALISGIIGAFAKQFFVYLRGTRKDAFDQVMEWNKKLEVRMEAMEQEIEEAKAEHKACMDAHEATKAEVNGLRLRVVELETEKRSWQGPGLGS